jgi:putative membrane protein
MKSFLYRILCGFCLGISVFAPGISGSIMAIIMGIYDKLIDITSNPFKHLKQNIKFLFPMGIGAVISLVLFILVFSYLFETYEKAVYMLFIGLIAGNLPMIYKEANKSEFKWHYPIGAIIAVLIAFIIGIMSEGTDTAQGIEAGSNLIYLAIGGAVAGFASLIPGMSVSMILIVMGVYDTLIASAKSLDIAVIATVGIAFVVAMVLSSRLIKFIFEKFSGLAHFMVLGFLVGSIGGIFCSLPANGSNVAGVIMLVLGLAISLLFVYLGKKVNIEEFE